MSVDELIDQWVEQHQEELLRFLSQLVQTPSEVLPPHPGGELACQQLVQAAYRQAGAAVDVFTPDEVPGLKEHPAYFPTWDGMPRSFENRPDVVGVFKGSGGGRSILFSAHVDTVSRQPLPWHESQPFSGEIKNGRLYGRGSWDTKWGIAVGLYSALCARAVAPGLRGDILVESVVDEEFGGAHGTLAARLRGYNADIAINSEPSNMIVTPCHRGGGEWRITVKGNAGMAFAGEKLVNPVYKLARLIEAVRAFDRDRNAHLVPAPFYEDDPSLPTYTCQVGGGGDSYADVAGIPAECYLIVWIEEHPGMDQETHQRNFIGFINRSLEQDPDFDGVYPEFRQTVRYMPPSSMDPSHPFLPVLKNAYHSVGQEFRLAGGAFACDTFVFNLHSPTPALTIGPRGGNAHSADEFVLVEDVLTLTRIYARAIVNWCS